MTSDYLTVEEIRRANIRSGGFWFSDGSMRFFKTFIDEAQVFGGNWFVYSNTFETSDGQSTTYWKVAHAHPDGTVCGDAIPMNTGVGVVGSSVKTKLEARKHAWRLEAGQIDCACVRCDNERRAG